MSKFLKMTAAFVFSAMVLEVHAEDNGSSTCQTFYDFAETVMEARQAGVPMPMVLNAAQGESILETIVMDAYDRPRFQTDEVQARTTQDFANSVFRECMAVFRKGR